MFGLIVLGSVVRTTGSGLACPDWPLCHGQLIPPLQFNIMLEWVHRLVALLVSVLLASTAAWVYARGAVRARLGGLVTIALGLLAAQVLLGALTVWKLLDPGVVGGHLAVGLLLFSTNFRKFRLDADALKDVAVTDITQQTIPQDFERDQRAHHCFEIRLAP